MNYKLDQKKKDLLKKDLGGELLTGKQSQLEREMAVNNFNMFL